MNYQSDDLVHTRDLAERNAILRTLDHVKAIAEFSPEGFLLYANPRYLEIFGYSLAQVQGAAHEMFCDPSYVASSEYSQFWIRLRAGDAYADRCERRAHDGSVRWLEATYAPIVDTGGRVVRILKLAGDVTQHILRERNAQEETRRLSLVADATDTAVVITDGDWKIVYVNGGFTRMFGLSLAQASGHIPPQLLAPQVSLAEIGSLHAGLREGVPIRRQELLRGSGGERYWCSVATNPVRDETGRLINAVSVITDITETKMHQVMQHRVLEAIAAERSVGEIATMVCDEVDRILPDAACCVLRFDASGRMIPLAAPRLTRGYLDHLSRHTLNESMIEPHGDSILVDGGAFIDIATDLRWQSFKDPLTAVGYRSFWAMPIRSAEGLTVGAVVFHYPECKQPDEFQRKLMAACVHLCALALEKVRSKARIHRLAFYDPLTNLPNRSLLNAKAEQALATAGRTNTPAAVLFIDFDRFKHVNDSLGHPAGDTLLKTVANRLLEGRRSADIVARLSGDEFVLVLPGCAGPCVAEVVERLQMVLHKPADLGGTSIRPSASIGIAMFPADGEDMETLMHRADMAMYQAKGEGRGTFAFFSSELNALAQERLSLEADLQRSMTEQTLHLNYQAQLDLQSNALHGVEALCRWTHSQRGHVQPSTFIPLAEECGLIDELTRWVLRTACAQLASWRRSGLRVPAISVNLSPITLHDAGLLSFVEDTLRSNGLRPADLIIEITEGVMLDQHAETRQTINALASLGVRLSMDDFGTGYSSLSYLHRLPITELKIDRSFVADLGFRDSALSLCTAIVQIGKSLGLTVVAEGIETPEQRRLLAEQGCQVAQGYFIAEPMDGTDFEAWIRNARSPEATGRCLELVH